MKVLIIEDDTIACDMTGITLERYGFIALQAHDGPTGIALARAEKPDLILLDLMMPFMPGDQVAKYMRNDPILGSIPIIILTAMSQRDLVIGLLKLNNVHDYLLKPVSPITLRQRIETVLGKICAHADYEVADEVIPGEND